MSIRREQPIFIGNEFPAIKEYTCETEKGTITYTDVTNAPNSSFSERRLYLKIENPGDPTSTDYYPVETNYEHEEITVISSFIYDGSSILYFWVPRMTLSRTPIPFEGRIYRATQSGNLFNVTNFTIYSCTAVIVNNDGSY